MEAKHVFERFRFPLIGPPSNSQRGGGGARQEGRGCRGVCNSSEIRDKKPPLLPGRRFCRIKGTVRKSVPPSGQISDCKLDCGL